MKRKTWIFLSTGILMVMGLLVTGCSNEETLALNERAKNIESINNYTHVTLQNVQTLIGTLRTQTRTSESEEYVSITDSEDGDTLFYVVNYPEGGWTMYASDRRVPPIVAENPKGRFYLQEFERSIGTWFEDMKEDMKAVKNAKDEELALTKTEIADNKSFWAFTSLESYSGSLNGMRAVNLHGHYEDSIIGSYTEDYNSIPHLLDTQWDQFNPYNIYCPEKVNPAPDEDTKCPAGCVAIAGAQMLYFLHQETGVPEIIPDSAYCYGNYTVIPRNWNQWYGGSNIWENMETLHGNSYNGRYAAPLIADIGSRVNMQYGNNGSSAATSSLVDSVFAPYGIGCQFATFNATLVNNSLLAGMPVIAHAKATEGGVHAFIIDAYKTIIIVIQYLLHWVPDPGYENTFCPNDRIVNFYSNPQIAYYKMNWGNPMPSGYEETWLASTGSWLAPNGAHFDTHRAIIYDFHVLN